MTYLAQTWTDGSLATPISAARLTVMENGIATALSGLIHAVGNSGTALTLDASSTSGYIKTITLTGTCTLTLTGASAGSVAVLELLLTQDATGSRTIVWPGSVKWAAATPAVLSTAAGARDRIGLVSYDAGTSWLANFLGKGYA